MGQKSLGPAHGLDKTHLNVAKVPLLKSGLAVTEIVLPHPDKCVGKAEGLDLFDVFK
jgi:hypothetical protein